MPGIEREGRYWTLRGAPDWKGFGERYGRDCFSVAGPGVLGLIWVGASVGKRSDRDRHRSLDAALSAAIAGVVGW